MTNLKCPISPDCRESSGRCLLHGLDGRSTLVCVFRFMGYALLRYRDSTPCGGRGVSQPGNDHRDVQKHPRMTDPNPYPRDM